MRTLLELIRIIVLYFIVCSFLGYFLNEIYLAMGINTETYGSIGFISIFISFFVLYRNKLQFSGWYQGKGREKLPKKVSQILILSSIAILLLPPVLKILLE
ncbi:hypothetical protein [Psychrobacillus antarcticus]|uniref:hypothetical protein n=1 Tax=Psychrobacillus antarcticus TaxID=2879115 RepID=UPI0024080178|nr:hypothetical protein [Psychrobacillus antarcticus]